MSLNFNHKASDLQWDEDEGVPTVITWSFGGNEVEVVGSWDNWTSRYPIFYLKFETKSGIVMGNPVLCFCRKALTKSGNEHSLVLVLGNGVYYYRFIVDGESRYITNEPYVAGEAGRCINILDVNVRILSVF